ncbi:aminopeptidase N [Gregarina niphandrodes]|uniref:Aminopeptidase N n=1 Tax=Gregarina niphandrodes TaxID=110365 RepID=A0A023AZ68_GRENI|nr:aminopeptidase N [Gregarina niphandrodes]EZG43958.1 aminopeptidase N [Gregarina niphandrodes]|eukprot:XP_011132877.1 aminopeptidase N [Gregarina niphandrodes]
MCFVTPESYGPTPPFEFEHVDLTFYLDETNTKVVSKLTVKPKESKDLCLNGEELKLESVELDGQKLEAGGKDFEEKEGLLIVKKDSWGGKEKFVLQFTNFVNPTANTALMGLYKSANLLCTQCEAEGFRRITYFIDRPDVMSKYKVTLVGDKARYPVMLSNGNLIKSEDQGSNHVCVYEDPSKKPCYLFAVVAGPLGVLEDTFKNPSDGPDPNREIKLYCYAEEKYLARCKWALECVKKAMFWDYTVWHRPYDLDRFSIICIEDFNVGAMENKSLTTYNISCILGCKDTATDGRLQRISAVIGHEYFHNWSGNRVTVESWFNVTLKEGLTNFREQEFQRWAWNEGVQRIEAVRALRALQFPEDAGPLSHPVCPPKYKSIDNFYTMTIYEKGSEVINMLEHLVGKANFRKGTDHYFTKYDGCAVNYHDFASAIFDASGWKKEDYDQFFLWYHQKGTPRLVVEVLEVEDSAITVKVTQKLPAHAGAEGQEAKAYMMPFTVGVIDRESKKEAVPTQKFKLTEFETTLKIDGSAGDKPQKVTGLKKGGFALSVNREFSAPVIVEGLECPEDLSLLLGYDTDSFNRWDAAQVLYKRAIMQKFADKNTAPGELDSYIKNGIQGLLAENERVGGKNNGFLAFCLGLPLAAALEATMEQSDPVLLSKCTHALRKEIAATFKKEFTERFNKLWNEGKDEGHWEITEEACSKRQLRNACLSYISMIDEHTSDEDVKATKERITAYEAKCQTYNDRQAVYNIQMGWSKRMASEKDAAIDKFYKHVEHDENLLDDWFAGITCSPADDTLQRAEKLRQHPRYAESTNPNRFRAVTRAFSNNLRIFHDESGKGYEFVAQEVARFDKINGSVAAVCAKQLVNYNKYSPERQTQMKAQVDWLASQTLSKSTQEIVSCHK